MPKLYNVSAMLFASLSFCLIDNIQFNNALNGEAITTVQMPEGMQAVPLESWQIYQQNPAISVDPRLDLDMRKLLEPTLGCGRFDWFVAFVTDELLTINIV